MIRILFGFAMGVVLTLSFLQTTGTSPSSALNVLFDKDSYPEVNVDKIQQQVETQVQRIIN